MEKSDVWKVYERFTENAIYKKNVRESYKKHRIKLRKKHITALIILVIISIFHLYKIFVITIISIKFAVKSVYRGSQWQWQKRTEWQPGQVLRLVDNYEVVSEALEIRIQNFYGNLMRS